MASTLSTLIGLSRTIESSFLSVIVSMLIAVSAVVIREAAAQGSVVSSKVYRGASWITGS